MPRQTAPSSGSRRLPRLVLVGAGHAHLEVLRRLAEEEHPAVDLTVVSPVTHHLYSGMVPGYLQGGYREDEISFELVPLVERAGGRLVGAWGHGVAPERQVLHVSSEMPGTPSGGPASSRSSEASGTSSTDPSEASGTSASDPGRNMPGTGSRPSQSVASERSTIVPEVSGTREIAYDLVSFNVGSRAAGTGTPGVGEHAALVKPIDRAVELRRQIARLAAEGGAGARRVAVVGGGAAGVEVALAIDAVLGRLGRRRQITLFEAGPRILAGYSKRVREAALGVLGRRGLAVEIDRPVAAVAADRIASRDGVEHGADLTVWVTGPSAPPLFEGSGLALDGSGYLLVTPRLASVSDGRIFAVGDCATLAEHPATPKAGVYAVRQGPVLFASLLAALGVGEPPRYEPQDGFLSILNTGDGKALLRYRRIVSHSRWAWWLKDRIDRRFMSKYQPARPERP